MKQKVVESEIREYILSGDVSRISIPENGNMNDLIQSGLYQKVTFCDHHYYINFFKFAQYSNYARIHYTQFNISRKMPKDLQKILHYDQIDQGLSTDSQSNSIRQKYTNPLTLKYLEEFIKANQNEKFQVTNESYFLFVKLSSFFVTKVFQAVLDKYAKECFVDPSFVLLQYLSLLTLNESEKLLFIRASCFDPEIIENIIVGNIKLYLPHELFKDIPVEIIYRILEKTGLSIPQDLLYHFIVSDLKKFQILCHFIKMEDLNDQKKQFLLDHIRNDSSLLHNFIFPEPLISQLMSINRILVSQKDDIQKFTDENDNLKNNLMSLTDEISMLKAENMKLTEELNVCHSQMSNDKKLIENLVLHHQSIFHYICTIGHVEFAELLLNQPGVNVNSKYQIVFVNI
ncbi:hypothetical protein TRFO_05808 [Tritrichomonas foetus]|uniref:Uncharacterized protein n=1 Tax=Tritrichomonas foetus TaxID=1144522 RepID=A0A1J4K7K8_9EUKA|nr:hypothetical protein TRFO_05808 [Tritrichomonas foetus]|eukprot:OHT05678.1 hypothetical protein TRFO_05808 [Tritrichomonas foetus]